jgi:hypothetical protein
LGRVDRAVGSGRLETVRMVCDAMASRRTGAVSIGLARQALPKAPAALTFDRLLLFGRSPWLMLCVPFARNLSCARGDPSVVITFHRRSDP